MKELILYNHAPSIEDLESCLTDVEVPCIYGAKTLLESEAFKLAGEKAFKITVRIEEIPE